MSKHEKHVRRERKKTDRARRLRDHFRHPTSHIPHGPAALAAAAVIAAGTQAYAVPVRFDNPPGAGHFDWGGVGAEPNRLLDIVAPESAQPPGTTQPGVFTHLTTNPSSVAGAWGGAVQLGGAYGLFVTGVDAGELIPSGLSWGTQGYVYYPGFGSDLPEGQATYLGARFDLGSGDQYAWIGVVRTGIEVDAFAWGYETEVGVPIPAGIPEPGSLALLAFGALAVCRRRP